MENRRFNYLKYFKLFNSSFQHILGTGENVSPSSWSAGCGKHPRCPLPVCPLPVCPRCVEPTPPVPGSPAAHLRPRFRPSPERASSGQSRPRWPGATGSGDPRCRPSSSGPRLCPALREKSWKREETSHSLLGLSAMNRELEPRHTPGCPRSHPGDLLQAEDGPQDGLASASPELGGFPGQTPGS